jgi:dsRNA-specific ribonuclease
MKRSTAKGSSLCYRILYSILMQIISTRLKMLGDSVLKLAMSHAVYTFNPRAREGDLTSKRTQASTVNLLQRP